MKSLIPIFLIIICLCSCSSDNETIINQAPLNFTDVMTFQTDTLEVDMISDASENSIYITYSAIPDESENILKFDVSTLDAIITTHQDFNESRQIEIVNNSLYSISSSSIYRMNLDLENFEIIYDGGIFQYVYFYSRVTVLDENIYLPFGIDNIVMYNTLTNTFSGSYINSDTNLRSDAEIYNNKLYSFGGNRINGFGAVINEINIFDLGTNQWTQNYLPYNVFESFTSLYNDSIIISGNKNLDQTSSFLAEYNPITNTYTEIQSNLDLLNISIRGVTVLNDEIFIAYVDLISPTPNLLNIKVVKASLL